jgi:hypothetical protein
MSVPLTPAAAGRLQLAQQAAQRFNLMFVGEFLAFGMFDQFQNLFHLPERLLQGLDNLHHFIHSPADGGSGLPNGRRVAGRDGRFGRLVGRRCRRQSRRAPTRSAPAPAASPAPAPPARFLRLRRPVRFG